MTNDKQVEVWRSEFEATIDKPYLLHRFPSGTYSWDSTEWMWAGFQRAKRSLPPIDLPPYEKPELTAREAGYNLGISESKLAITAAGYSYRVKV